MQNVYQILIINIVYSSHICVYYNFWYILFESVKNEYYDSVLLLKKL